MICEALLGATFLTITLRDKDETPWQGVALKKNYTLILCSGQIMPDRVLRLFHAREKRGSLRWVLRHTGHFPGRVRRVRL
jgi:hypothetical protein